MGNCQAAEAATVVIQHPGGKVERAYWSLSANQVMAANPGHYVAVIITTTTTTTSTAAASASSSVTGARKKRDSSSGGAAASGAATTQAQVKHLKLLRPDDTLHIGHVYRLVSFEEVLREFASKKHVKLSRLLVKQKDGQQKPRSGKGSGAAASTRSRRVDCRSTTAATQPSLSTTISKHERALATEERKKQEQREEAAEEEEKARVEAELEEAVQRLQARAGTVLNGGGALGVAAYYRHGGQWRPALQSISEAKESEKS